MLAFLPLLILGAKQFVPLPLHEWIGELDEDLSLHRRMDHAILKGAVAIDVDDVAEAALGQLERHDVGVARGPISDPEGLAVVPDRVGAEVVDDCAALGDAVDLLSRHDAGGGNLFTPQDSPIHFGEGKCPLPERLYRFCASSLRLLLQPLHPGLAAIFGVYLLLCPPRLGVQQVELALVFPVDGGVEPTLFVPAHSRGPRPRSVRHVFGQDEFFFSGVIQSDEVQIFLLRLIPGFPKALVFFSKRIGRGIGSPLIPFFWLDVDTPFRLRLEWP